MNEQNKKLIKMIDLVIEKCIAQANSTIHSTDSATWGRTAIVWLEARKAAYQFLSEEESK